MDKHEFQRVVSQPQHQDRHDYQSAPQQKQMAPHELHLEQPVQHPQGKLNSSTN